MIGGTRRHRGQWRNWCEDSSSNFSKTLRSRLSSCDGILAWKTCPSSCPVVPACPSTRGSFHSRGSGLGWDCPTLTTSTGLRCGDQDFSPTTGFTGGPSSGLLRPSSPAHGGSTGQTPSTGRPGRLRGRRSRPRSGVETSLFGCRATRVGRAEGTLGPDPGGRDRRPNSKRYFGETSNSVWFSGTLLVGR